MRWIGRWGLLVGMILGVVLMGGRPLPASAATVTDSDCSAATGQASLQTAITNAGAGGTVRFTCSGDIPFNSLIGITQSVTLDGTGQSVTLDGQNKTELFFVNVTETFTLIGLTLTRGSSCCGGAIFADGNLVIKSSSFISNSARLGGAIDTFFDTVTISNSTFYNNSASSGFPGQGGAILLDSTTSGVTISNSTFYQNSNPGNPGGAISNGGTNNLTIKNSTFTGNSAGSGGAIDGNATVRATILSGNTATGTGPECDATLTSQDFNQIDTASGCTITGTTTHNIMTSALLQSFGNNGGPTQTIPTAANSDGNNFIPFLPVNQCGSAIDQRGYARGNTITGACNIGATDNGSTSCVKPTFSSSYDAGTKTLSVTATDNNVGIDSLSVVKSSNATVTIPSFTPGASSVTATVQKMAANQPARASFRAINTLGCSVDPAPAALTVVPGQPLKQTFTDIAQSESQVTISNGRPGLTILVLWVNGKPVVVNGLKAGEQRVVSIAAALHAGSNSVQVLGLGPMGSSATVLIGE